MELHQLTEHVFYTESDPATDRPVLGYIMGNRSAVMVDAGNSARHGAEYLDAVRARGFAAPAHCVITHWHWDHTFGMHALAAETIAHERTNEALRRMAEWEWSDEAMKRRLAAGEEIPFADEHIRAEYPRLEEIKIVPARRSWTEEMTIDCGGVTGTILHLPSAHSDDSLVVLVPEERVLFLGDLYNDDFYQDHRRDLDKTRQLYEGLDRLDFELAVPGHGAPVRKESVMAFLGRFLSA